MTHILRIDTRGVRLKLRAQKGTKHSHGSRSALQPCVSERLGDRAGTPHTPANHRVATVA
jgi:hypothetical protein